jgi:hypothetical protein
VDEIAGGDAEEVSHKHFVAPACKSHRRSSPLLAGFSAKLSPCLTVTASSFLLTPVTYYDRLKKMVGFRNLAVQQYRELDLDILEAVIRTNLDDLLAFAQAMRPEL